MNDLAFTDVLDTEFWYLKNHRLDPTRHGIFKLLGSDLDDEPSLVKMQETLSIAKDLVITPFEVQDTKYYCIIEQSKKESAFQKMRTQPYYIEYCYVGELGQVACSLEGAVNCIVCENEHEATRIYVLLKNRICTVQEYKIGDKCVYANPTLQVGIICGISDNTKGTTIYTVRPYNTKGAKKNFTYNELSHVTRFRKFYNGNNYTDLFYMDFDALVDKGMKFCGF